MTLFGLPEEVKFCTRCVVSNQRPASTVEYSHVPTSKKETIHFDEEGVCDACRVAEKKAQIDWEERKRQLADLCDRYRSRDGSYDCIVPGSGGKDSFFAAHQLRYNYGMHPLTVTWAPHIYTDWGWRNFQRWLDAGFSNYLCTPDRRVHRLLTRLALENLFHPFQPFIVGQKSLAPKLAAMFNIPLVFYGESEAEYGDPKARIDSPQRDSSYHTSGTGANLHLGGVSIPDLRSRYGLSMADLEPYLPAHEQTLAAAKVEVHYLGWYLKWRPQDSYYYAVQHGNFECCPERTPGTWSKYSGIDDKSDDLHFWTTWIKFGIGRATYDAAQEIRSGEITREEGVSLVKRFDGEYPSRFESEMFEYLSLPGFDPMTKDYLYNLADRFRSPHLWRKDNGEWQLKHTVWNHHSSGGA